jgi:hypothetical protein
MPVSLTSNIVSIASSTADRFAEADNDRSQRSALPPEDRPSPPRTGPRAVAAFAPVEAPARSLEAGAPPASGTGSRIDTFA